jgi:hypothetical protein
VTSAIDIARLMALGADWCNTVRVFNFHQQTLHALQELVQAAGINHPNQITAHHIVRRSTDQKVRSLAQLILTQLPDLALLESDLQALPVIYRLTWPRASAASFMLQGNDALALEV